MTWGNESGLETAGMRWTPLTRTLLIAMGAVFVVQALFHRAGSPWLELTFGLSVTGMKFGHLWQLVTYMFLHGNLLHLLLNGLALFFFGPELERFLGRTRFLTLFFLAGILGGVGWLALTFPSEGLCIGMSGAIFGLLGAFAALFPHREVVLLVFFVLPVRMKAWVMVAGLGAIQLLMMLNPSHGGIAYAAHLAGGLAGYLYGKSLLSAPPTWVRFLTSIIRIRRRGGSSPSPGSPSATVSPAEINRILDKIADQGIHTLTAREREILGRAGKR